MDFREGFVMYLKCYDLMKLPIFKNIQLVGGASGLNRQISWIYVSTTPSLESWLRGGELVFIVHNSNLKQRLQEAVTSQAAGVVVLKSADNRSVLDQDEIDFANQFDLPLFEMDYHVRLVDVTREVSIGIMSRQKKIDYLDQFFHRILFSTDLDAAAADDFTLHFGFQSGHRYVIATIHAAAGPLLEDLEPSLQLYLADPELRVFMKQFDSYLVILIHCPRDRVDPARRLLQSAFSILEEKFPDRLLMSIGSACDELTGIRESYQRSMRAIALCSGKIRLVDYEALGFDRLLINGKDEDLLEYARSVLGEVRAYDEANNTAFLKTMEGFILSNGNISKAASHLYIHKNTCIYRIARIEELFQMDLNDALIRADILNCLKIFRFFNQMD